MTTYVLWHGRKVGILGQDSPSEIAYRCKEEDQATMREEAVERLASNWDARNLAEDIVSGFYSSWTDVDHFAPIVEDAVEFLLDCPGEECEGFTLQLPEERIFWWSKAGGELMAVEGATPAALAERMLEASRKSAAYFAVHHYLDRVRREPYLDLDWERALAFGLMNSDTFILYERVKNILEEHWDELMSKSVLKGAYESGDLFTLNNQ